MSAPTTRERHPGAGVAGDLVDERIGTESSFPAAVPGLLPPQHGHHNYAARRDEFRARLVHLSRAELVVVALREFDRADRGLLHLITTRDEPQMLAAKQASAAISTAFDWTASSRRPSHAELVQRRVDHATPCRRSSSCRCVECMGVSG